MRYRILQASIVLAAAVLMAGCTSTHSGTPSPTSSNNGQGASGPNQPPRSRSAPAVSAPLNDAALVSNPCSALSTTQLTAIGFTSSTRTSVQHMSVGDMCNWTDDTVGTTGASFGVSVQKDLRGGLNAIYAQKKEMAYFTPVMVQNYPGVLASQDDNRSGGSCVLNLGVSNASALLIEYDGGPSSADPCQKAKAVGGAVIATLRGEV